MTTAPDIALAVVLPCLNEAANLRELLPRITDALRNIPAPCAVYVVDGGSTDDTVATAQAHGAQVIQQRGRGYGGALKTAFEDIDAAYLLTMDADFSHHPVFIQYLYERRNDAEVIIASRYVSQGHAEMHWTRRLLSTLLNAVFRRVLAVDVRDLSSGFRLYRRSAVARLQLEYETYAVLQEILVKAYCQGYKVMEEPFHYLPRRHGTTHARLVAFGLAYLRALYRLWLLRNSPHAADHETRAFRSNNPLRRLRHRRRYRSIMQAVGDQQRVLNVDCGASQTLNAVPQSVGLDPHHHKLRFMRRPARLLVNAQAAAMPFADDTFEVIILSQGLGTPQQADGVLRETARCLRDDGLLLVSTTTARNTLRQQLDTQGFHIIEAERILGAEIMVQARRHKA